MSLVSLMTLEEMYKALEDMKALMEGWGWGISSLGGAYHATVFTEGVQFQGMFIQYGHMPITSLRCKTFYDAMAFCLNTLWEHKQRIETEKKLLEEGGDIGKA